MTIASITAALVVGLAAGSAGRLVLRPGRPVPMWVLWAIGVAAALAGAMAARLVGIDTSRLGSAEIGVQIVAATVAVIGAVGAPAGRQRRSRPLPRGHGAAKRHDDGS